VYKLKPLNTINVFFIWALNFKTLCGPPIGLTSEVIHIDLVNPIGLSKKVRLSARAREELGNFIMNLSNLQQMISDKESELARFRQAANDAAQQKEEEVRRHTLGELKLLSMMVVAAFNKLVDLINNVPPILKICWTLWR
jgi:hypothetical protein